MIMRLWFALLSIHTGKIARPDSFQDLGCPRWSEVHFNEKPGTQRCADAKIHT